MTTTILVIEDERLTRSSLISFLQSEGFTTLEATNGHMGIELAKNHLPDLIICDILMPELDGYDVLTTLQIDPKTASIPFIFLTVTATEEGWQQSMDMGADDYLSKPITSDKLRAAIAAQLEKKHRPAPSPDFSAPLNSPAQQTSLGASPETPVDTAKAMLLDQLCNNLQAYLLQAKGTLDTLGQTVTSSEQKQAFNQLQADFTRLLSLVNETNALQASLTNENLDTLLELFQLQHSNQ